MVVPRIVVTGVGFLRATGFLVRLSPHLQVLHLYPSPLPLEVVEADDTSQMQYLGIASPYHRRRPGGEPTQASPAAADPPVATPRPSMQ